MLKKKRKKLTNHSEPSLSASKSAKKSLAITSYQKEPTTESILQTTDTKPLSEIVNESKISLANAELKDVKRGRGRPKGSANKPAEPVAATGAATNQAAPVRSPFYPMLQQGLKMPYQLAASRTGFKGWAIDDQESQMIAEPLDTWLAPMLQSLDPATSKWAGLGLCAVAAAMVTWPRMLAYEDFKRERLEALRKKSDEKQTAPEVLPPQNGAGEKKTAFEYFAERNIR